MESVLELMLSILKHMVLLVCHGQDIRHEKTLHLLQFTKLFHTTSIIGNFVTNCSSCYKNICCLVRDEIL